MILNLLLDGSKTAGEIADKLHIQKSAIRTHLGSLQAEQTVKSYFRVERLGRGRPKKVYEITESGREGKVNPNVQLKECIALGNNHSRHVIATTTNNNKDKLKP